MPLTREDLPPGLVSAVEAQSAVLFMGAGSSFGARHPRDERIPSGERLRDLIADKFLAGALKDKALSAVAEYAINEADLPSLQQFVRDLFLEFAPSDFH